MLDFMYDLPNWMLFLVCVLLTGLLVVSAAASMWLLRLIWPNRHKTTMISTMLSGVLLPTGMVVAFVASDIWQHEAKGQTAVEQEAMAVGDILRIAQHLPTDLREQLTGLTDDYIREVVEVEWPLMAKGQASRQADDSLDALAYMAIQLEVLAEQAKSAPAILLRQSAKDLRHYTQQVDVARNHRLLVSHSRVAATKWTTVLVLLFVAACVICEIHLTQRRALVMALGLFTLGFGATMYLIASYERPFTGATIIEPTSMTLLLVRN
ncbi:hypothetical protein [Castellaniella sp.]|uniref:bestrophin-like domain n=1 Tax=Castellaniella sp. TaxID=1955812 RepID=UPI002AFF4F59|nr:hypothetical protein [Castellaniella sp.]